MAGHPSGWDGRSTPPRGGSRRRSDQRRLLVELELDDSLYQGSLRAAAEQDALWRSQGDTSGRGLQYTADSDHDRQYQQRYADHKAVVAPRTRPQSATSRDRSRATSRQSRDYQVQQPPARRLLSPYKLKQQVLGSRHEQAAAASHHHRQTQHPVSVNSVQRTVRSPSVHQSPTQLVIDAIRQNIRLRDQVVAHLQQELLAALPLRRVSHMETGIPHQIVKLLNKVRSLSLAVVETVAYLQSEFSDSGVSGDHQVLEREFYGYLLQMASSDLDFLACSPHLQLFFEDLEVSLARNPFVDGLSLDSSEVLLCSCHQSSTSTALFCSASSSSSSLFRLLTNKLDAFALQTQRCFPGWQILPIERVAAALLHLVDLETRFNAVQLLPRYLQPPTAPNESRYFQQQLHMPDQTTSMYGTFPDEQAQWAPTSQSQPAYNYVADQDREDSAVVEAWTNSPISKNPVQTVVPPLSPWNSVSKTLDQSRDTSVSNSSDGKSGRKEGVARLPSPLSSSPKRMLEMYTQPAQDAAMTDPGLTNGGKYGVIQSDPMLSSTLPIAARKLSGRSSPAEIPDNDYLSLTSVQMSSTPTSQDMAAERKTSSRNSPVGRPASRKKSKGPGACNAASGTSVVVEGLISEASTQTAHDIKAMARHLPNKEKYEEMIQACDNEATGDIVPESSPPRTTIPHADLSGEMDAIGRHTTTRSAPSPLIEHDGLEPRISISDSSATPGDWISPNDIVPDIPSDSPIAGGLSAPCEPTHEVCADYQDSMAFLHTETMVDNSSKCDEASDGEAVENVDGEYDCDFEYSSNEALSSIAQALELLPRVSLGSTMSTDDNECYEAEEDIQPPKSDIKASAGSSSVNETGAPSVGAFGSARETPHSTENTGTALMDGIASDHSIIDDMHLGEDYAFAYSSSDAVSSIALALSLLPQVSRDGPLFISEVQSEVQPPRSNEDDQLKIDSIHCATADEMVHELASSPGLADIDVPDAAVCSPSREADPMPVGDKESSNDDGVSSGLDRIFALCRDVKVAAYDMNHWISQREVEDHFQAVSQPYASLRSRQTPSHTAVEAPRYLERELKMLRRNFAYWRVACADQKRAKLVVRRSVARRKINKFLRHRFQLRLQAREAYERRIESLAASRIQRNWAVYRQKQDVARRKAGFRVAHMAFQRVRFFAGISHRQRRRESAKEQVVRWWRRRRSRLKRQKQQQEKVARERERRSRASKEVQRFLKEVVLRRKLKAAQEMTRNVLFKEKLKWTKAQRDVETGMKLNAKHRRELIADMNAKLADLDHKWKTAEQEKLQLLSHHERVLQQQQHIFERKRRALAALKIQMFLNVFLLYRKLQGVEKEKQRCERQLRHTTLTKELLGVEAQQHASKLRTQARVLERKLGRVSQQALEDDTRHRQALQALEARERAIQERAARQTIKAFIDFRVLKRRVKSERQQRLLEQKRLFAEKREQELMSEQDQMEQRRVAISVANDLTQRLSELEEQSQALVAAKNQLMLEKQQEAQQAAAILEERRFASSKQQVTAWISEQIRLSRVKREKEEIRISAASAMAEEKRRQQQELQRKAREIASIKVSGFVRQCAGQRRSRIRAEMVQQQQQEQTAWRDQVRAQCAQTQLVQIIIEAKLLSEREASCGVEQATCGMLRLQAGLVRKCTRLRHLRTLRSAREIQRSWRRWRRRQAIKHAENMILAQLEETKRRHELARKLQAYWRKWAIERARRREQERVLQERLEGIRNRVCARKIQETWWNWQQQQRVEKGRKRIEQDTHMAALRIQRSWLRWQRRQRAEKEEERARVHRETSAGRIQRNWRASRKRSQQWEEGCARNARVRRIQQCWRIYRLRMEQCERARREQQKSAMKIRRGCYAWWQRRQQAKEEERVWKKQNDAVRRIHTAWRECQQRRQEEQERIQREQREETERTRRRNDEVTKALRIQRVWLKHQRQREEERQRIAREERLRGARAIQINWRQWHKRQQAEQERRHMEETQHASACKLQDEWRKWQQAQCAKREAERLLQEQKAVVLTLEKRWRTGQQQQRERLERERLRKAKEASALLIQKCWRLRQAQQASSLKIQRTWKLNQQRRRMERERIQHEQNMSALKIQTHWLKWQHRQELAKERIRLEQDASSLKIQRNWGLSRQRRKVEQERGRHQQHMSALKIQRNWHKWQFGRHEELERELLESGRKASVRQTEDPEAAAQQQRDEVERLQKEQLKRQEKLDALKYRFCGRCITRTLKTFHRSQRQEKAAVVIEAIWRGKMCRQQYSLALEAKRVEDARVYLLKVSVFAAKVQVCWRQWHRGVRQIRRAAVKAMELQLIEEEKAVERRNLMAKRSLAARKIHNLLRGYVARKRPREQLPFTEQPTEFTQPQLEDWTLAGVEKTINDWRQRELPYIVTRSVNHLLLCHDVAKVLQRCVRRHQRRQRLHFHVPRSLIASSAIGSVENADDNFHFYFQRASAWLEWRGDTKASATTSQSDVARSSLSLRLRFDAPLTRKLLLLLGHQDSCSASDFQQIILKIAADALPIFQSPVCSQSNSNPTRELRYLEVEELELPRFAAWIRQEPRPSSSSSSSLEIQRTKPSLSIFDAVENASVADAMLLQQRGVNLGALEATTNRNALHLLAVSTESYRFRVEMLEFLLHCDADLDVNAADSNGDTPLLLFATHGHLEFMQTLLKHGADVHQTNNKGQNVLHHACEQDHVEICAFLQQLMAGARVEAVKGLEERETIRSLHTPDVAGRYPLHILAEKGFLECAKQVLVVADTRNSACNAALQAQGDAQGRTPLHLAVLAHDTAMAAFLLLPGGGADPNALDDLHRAALHFAVDSPAALPLVSRLAQNGADLNVADERGDTPLHWVAFSGRAAVALHLLALGADPTLVNSDWETPAQISAAYGQLDCMRLLLQAQRRRDASAAGERTETTQPRAIQQPEEKTALEPLEDAVNHLHQQQASAQSYRVSTPSDNEDVEALSERARGGYWEELHQEVQLVEESGQFSSEDEQDWLFDDDDDENP